MSIEKLSRGEILQALNSRQHKVTKKTQISNIKEQQTQEALNFIKVEWELN